MKDKDSAPRPLGKVLVPEDSLGFPENPVVLVEGSYRPGWSHRLPVVARTNIDLYLQLFRLSGNSGAKDLLRLTSASLLLAP